MSRLQDPEVELVIAPGGSLRGVYDERFDLKPLGALSIRRGSHVEPNPQGEWTADLSPCGGPTLGPFPCRSEALAAELRWLKEHWLVQPVSLESVSLESVHHVRQIRWDTDGLDPVELQLPSELLIQGDPEQFADLLADHYHWCVFGLEAEPLPAELTAEQLNRFGQLPLLRSG